MEHERVYSFKGDKSYLDDLGNLGDKKMMKLKNFSLNEALKTAVLCEGKLKAKHMKEIEIMFITETPWNYWLFAETQLTVASVQSNCHVCYKILSHQDGINK
jgi:hypothetical protein